MVLKVLSDTCWELTAMDSRSYEKEGRGCVRCVLVGGRAVFCVGL